MINLLMEDIARETFKMQRYLTRQERNEIFKHIKETDNFILYDQYREAEANLRTAVNSLLAIYQQTERAFSDLKTYIFLWDNLDNTELLVNLILHEIKDPKKRKKTAERASKESYFFLSKLQVTEEGYLTTDIKSPQIINGDNTVSFVTAMGKAREIAISEVVKFMSCEKAILDYMKEKKFYSKTYKSKIKQISDYMRLPLITWPKYREELKESEPNNGKKRLKDLQNRYILTIDFKKLKIDLNIYYWFKKTYLK